jgi:hypothetical protein
LKIIKDPEKWLELVKAKEQDLRDACIQAAKKAWEGEVQKGMEVRVYLTLQSGDITIKIVPQFPITPCLSILNGGAMCIFSCPPVTVSNVQKNEYDIKRIEFDVNIGPETFEEFKQRQIVDAAERVVEDTITMLQREIQEQKEDEIERCENEGRSYMEEGPSL